MTKPEKPKGILTESQRKNIFTPPEKPKDDSLNHFGPLEPQKSRPTLSPPPFQTEAEIEANVRRQQEKIRKIIMIENVSYLTILEHVLAEDEDFQAKTLNQEQIEDALIQRLATFLGSFQYRITLAFKISIIHLVFPKPDSYKNFDSAHVSSTLRKDRININFINDKEFEQFCQGLAFWRCKMNYFRVDQPTFKLAMNNTLDCIKKERDI